MTAKLLADFHFTRKYTSMVPRARQKCGIQDRANIHSSVCFELRGMNSYVHHLHLVAAWPLYLIMEN